MPYVFLIFKMLSIKSAKNQYCKIFSLICEFIFTKLSTHCSDFEAVKGSFTFSQALTLELALGTLL